MRPAIRFVERLGKKLTPVFLGCLLALLFVFGAQATQGTFTSPAVVPDVADYPLTGIPQVDATNFVNTGVWNIGTAPLPYQTANTLNYTNSGTMNGSVGWEFDFGPLAKGGRGWSANFFNDNNGTISALDGSVIFNNSIFTIGYLLISATNVVNKGMLDAGPNGELIINGSEVNLSRSLLEITPLVGVGSSNGSTNFVSDTAIYDQFWNGAISNKLTVTGSPWDGTAVSEFTFFNVNLPCGQSTELIGPFIPQVSDSLSNGVGPRLLTLTNSLFATTNFIVFSNEVRQAVFVFIGDTNIVPAIHFDPTPSLTNLFHPMAVQLTTVSTNLVTGTLLTNTIYVVDSLGSVTNQGLVENEAINPGALCTSPTFRPGTVIVSRTDPNFAFADGLPGMGPPPANFLYDPLTFSNVVATGIADVYSALVDNLAAEQPPGFSITNAPGKIRIIANDLNLSKTRISAASEILIQATNLISSAGAVMDCQNLSYNFGSTNGSLNIVNLAGQNVQRLSGTIKEWTGLWTNYIVKVFPNFVTNTTAGGSMESDITNVTEVDIVMMVVDASGLQTTLPVIVQDLVLHSTNMIVSDSMTVTNTLLFDGQSLTIQGGLNLGGGLQNWNSATAPTLLFFTNNGFLNLPNSAHFGDDRAVKYATFVNQGAISSGGQTINSDYLDINGGTNEADTADFTATCRTGLVTNAKIFAVGDIQFFANNLQIDPSTLSSGGAIDFTVTNSLSDAGIGTGNMFACQNGFNLLIKPAIGDLLGTTITDTALGQDEVDHVWAGHDFGAFVTGYSNNAAIGTLILDQASTIFEPLFHFSGASAANGLYVSNLDLSTLTDYTNELEIDPNLVIYFISANLNNNVNIAPFPSAEAFLNGQFGGHLRWAQGLPPLPNTKISGSMLVGGQFQLNFTGSGSSSQTNVVEASTNLINWVPIYTNIGSLIVTDRAANSFPHRFYRIKSSSP